MFCIIVPRNDCIILNCETVMIASSLIIKLCSNKKLRDQNLDQSNINHWNAISLKSDVTREGNTYIFMVDRQKPTKEA